MSRVGDVDMKLQTVTNGLFDIYKHVTKLKRFQTFAECFNFKIKNDFPVASL